MSKKRGNIILNIIYIGLKVLFRDKIAKVSLKIYCEPKNFLVARIPSNQATQLFVGLTLGYLLPKKNRGSPQKVKKQLFERCKPLEK